MSRKASATPAWSFVAVNPGHQTSFQARKPMVAPAIVTTKSGATIGFLAWNDVWWPGFTATNDQAGVAEAFRDIGHMMRDIRRLAKRVDYVVVGYHWGYEYQHYPVGQQTKE